MLPYIDPATEISAENELVHAAHVTLRQIVCRKRDRAVLLPPAEIVWFQVEDGIVKAHTAAERFWVKYQLGELEAGLPRESVLPRAAGDCRRRAPGQTYAAADSWSLGFPHSTSRNPRPRDFD